MFSNPLLRHIIGVPGALAIAVGLYLGMNAVTSVKEIVVEERQFITLDRITPEEQEVEDLIEDQVVAERLDSADKPPPPPKLTASKSDVNIGAPEITGAAPTELEFDGVENLSFDPVAINDQDAQPLSPPIPDYPSRLLSRGVEGECDVRFDVDVRGKPYNIVADCTNSGFKRSAEEAVADVEFAPKIVNGNPAERRNVVYPVVYQISN